MVKYDDIQSTDEQYSDIDVTRYEGSGGVALGRSWNSNGSTEKDGFYINDGERDELSQLLSTRDDGENSDSSQSDGQQCCDSSSDECTDDSREVYESEAETFDGSYYRHEWSSGDIEMSVESDPEQWPFWSVLLFELLRCCEFGTESDDRDFVETIVREL